MNKIFMGNDFDEIYKEIVEGLLTDPEYTIKNRKEENLNEFINPSILLKDPSFCFALCRDMSFNYLKGELAWYLSGDPSIKPILQYSKFWQGISDDGWSANSNYGKLLLHDRNLHNYTQFEYAKFCLLNNVESKKAVMLIYKHDASFKSLDNPCTMYLQYFIRNNKLDLYVKMRSSDIYFGMPYDVPFFVLLQYKMLKELQQEKYSDLKIGYYNHNSGSLHIYERDFEKIKKAFKDYPEKYKGIDLIFHKQNLFDEIIKSRL